MKIALVAPLMEAVPPRLYGGTERIVAYLSDELTALGHDVTLFASGDSITKAKLDAGLALRAAAGPSDPRLSGAPYCHGVESWRARAHEFDVVHLASRLFRLSAVAAGRACRFHDLARPARPARAAAASTRLFGDVPVVSISDSQRDPLPQANYVATFITAFPRRCLLPGFGGGGYLAFLGRISPEKAPDAAIRHRRQSGHAAEDRGQGRQRRPAIFQPNIEPLLASPDVEFIGEIGEDQKEEFLGNAAALLFPIAWREPFGLVMIEAMACGTPGDRVRQRLGAGSPRRRRHGLHRRGRGAGGGSGQADRIGSTAPASARVFEERFTARRMAKELPRALSPFDRARATAATGGLSR